MPAIDTHLKAEIARVAMLWNEAKEAIGYAREALREQDLGKMNDAFELLQTFERKFP